MTCPLRSARAQRARSPAVEQSAPAAKGNVIEIADAFTNCPCERPYPRARRGTSVASSQYCVRVSPARGKTSRREILGEGCCGHSLENHSEQDVIRVAVAPASSRNELRRSPTNEADDRVVRNVFGHRTVKCVTRRRIIRNSGRVVEKLTNPDRLPFRILGKKLSQSVIECQPARARPAGGLQRPHTTW